MKGKKEIISFFKEMHDLCIEQNLDCSGCPIAENGMSCRIDNDFNPKIFEIIDRYKKCKLEKNQNNF